MFAAIRTPYLVSFEGAFKQPAAATEPPIGAPDKKTCKALLAERVKELDELQRILYAHDYHAVLLIFQAMDAAGKDGTIRAVLSGIDPAGCQVYSFKQPNPEELDHDFLWRSSCRLPERGRIGVFNRSYYEEVLVVRAHPDYLRAQKLPDDIDLTNLWCDRFESIRDHEKHLARNGTVILKFWLNVSAGEQQKRFLERLNEPKKHWKFAAADVQERAYWKDYMNFYEEALNETSRPWAPWYAIPADDKNFMRLMVVETIVSSLKSLKLRYPKVSNADRARFADARAMLENETKMS